MKAWGAFRTLYRRRFAESGGMESVRTSNAEHRTSNVEGQKCEEAMAAP